MTTLHSSIGTRVLDALVDIAKQQLLGTQEMLMVVQEMLVGSAKGQLLRVQYSLSLTTFLCILQHMVGAKRSKYRIGLVTAQIIYGLPPWMITLTLGLMHKASTIHVVYPVWACALVYAHGGVGSMVACQISDNDNSVSYLLKTVPLFAWTLWLAWFALFNGTLPQAVVLVVAFAVYGALAVSNIMDTLEAFYLASKSKGLPGFVAPRVEHMEENRDVPDEANANPASMRGYRYLVWSNPNPNGDDVTTEDIWEWVGTRVLQNSVGVERLKDMCLSYALFMLILIRFADFPLDKSRERKMRRFIRDGLLQTQDPFRVIEAELGFLFEFFYSRSRVYSSNIGRQAKAFIAVILLMLFCEFGIHLLDPDPNIGNGSDNKMGLTGMVVAVSTLFWFWNNIANSFSDRQVVLRLCEELSKLLMHGGDNEGARRDFEESLTGIWTDKSDRYWMSKCFGSQPWRRKLGQYSFLESYGKAPMFSGNLFSPFSVVANLPRLGQDGDYTVLLSGHVKQAIVASLRRHLLLSDHVEHPLTRGTNTITEHQLLELEHSPNSSDAHVILVWHIATRFCESESPPNNVYDSNFLVATQLSKYCAYLLTFAPELLPGHPYKTKGFFDSAVIQAQSLNIQGSDVRQLYQDLIGDAAGNETNENIVKKGAVVARQLIDQIMTRNRDQGWDVLAEFWAELLLYLAPSDNVAAHGEYLARGGEFITHIWALLTHAGIVERQQTD